MTREPTPAVADEVGKLDPRFSSQKPPLGAGRRHAS